MSAKRPGEPDEVGSVYAVLALKPGSGEGLAGIQVAAGWMPLAFTTKKALDDVLSICQGIADASGEELRVVRFDRAGILRTFRPAAAGGDVSRIVGGEDAT